jgi:hypothetical protein
MMEDNEEEVVILYRMCPDRERGNWCYVDTIGDVADLVGEMDLDGAGLIVEKISMTREQWEEMPEFEGF